MKPLLHHINQYWSKRSKDFANVRLEEMRSDRLRLWTEEILPYLPRRAGRLNILDVGTGAGFFAILLARQIDCHVVAIDLCRSMLQEAIRLSAGFGCPNITFREMDATRLDFADNQFDAVLVRNLTWTLLRPAKAYAEWLRVLRPGGILMNFDADYGGVDFTKSSGTSKTHAHAMIDQTLLAEGEELRRLLPLSREQRPFWDQAILQRLRVSSVELDTDLSRRIYIQRDTSYNPVPMFSLRAVK